MSKKEYEYTSLSAKKVYALLPYLKEGDIILYGSYIVIVCEDWDFYRPGYNDYDDSFMPHRLWDSTDGNYERWFDIYTNEELDIKCGDESIKQELLEDIARYEKRDCDDDTTLRKLKWFLSDYN